MNDQGFLTELRRLYPDPEDLKPLMFLLFVVSPTADELDAEQAQLLGEFVLRAGIAPDDDGPALVAKLLTYFEQHPLPQPMTAELRRLLGEAVARRLGEKAQGQIDGVLGGKSNRPDVVSNAPTFKGGPGARFRMP